MPRSSATCAIGRPLSSAKRTPRSSSSSGYFLGLDMTAEDLLSPGQHPGSEVPAKPGPAHLSLDRLTVLKRIALPERLPPTHHRQRCNREMSQPQNQQHHRRQPSSNNDLTPGPPS